MGSSLEEEEKKKKARIKNGRRSTSLDEDGASLDEDGTGARVQGKKASSGSETYWYPYLPYSFYKDQSRFPKVTQVTYETT